MQIVFKSYCQGKHTQSAFVSYVTVMVSVMKSVTIHVPEVYLRDIDQLVNSNYYLNRAEVIRVAIRDLISSEVWSKIKASNGGVKEYDAFDFGEKD